MILSVATTGPFMISFVWQMCSFMVAWPFRCELRDYIDYFMQCECMLQSSFSTLLTLTSFEG